MNNAATTFAGCAILLQYSTVAYCVSDDEGGRAVTVVDALLATSGFIH